MKPIFHPPSVPIRVILGSTAFSLIELLVVMAIIIMLTVITLPSMRSISSGTNLTGAAEDMAAVVNLARQRAGTFNRQVAIRFFRDTSSKPFTSYQLWEQKDSANPDSWTSIERVRHLPTGVVVTNSATYSPILEVATYQGTTNGMSFSDILFLPSGSIVAQTNATVTLVQAVGPATTGVVSGLPPNFATIAIESMNARPMIYRP
jgi:uncharacterized protein (TIGR02596 family)